MLFFCCVHLLFSSFPFRYSGEYHLCTGLSPRRVHCEAQRSIPTEASYLAKASSEAESVLRVLQRETRSSSQPAQSSMATALFTTPVPCHDVSGRDLSLPVHDKVCSPVSSSCRPGRHLLQGTFSDITPSAAAVQHRSTSLWSPNPSSSSSSQMSLINVPAWSSAALSAQQMTLPSYFQHPTTPSQVLHAATPTTSTHKSLTSVPSTSSLDSLDFHAPTARLQASPRGSSPQGAAHDMEVSKHASWGFPPSHSWTAIPKAISVATPAMDSPFDLDTPDAFPLTSLPGLVNQVPGLSCNVVPNQSMPLAQGGPSSLCLPLNPRQDVSSYAFYQSLWSAQGVHQHGIPGHQLATNVGDFLLNNPLYSTTAPSTNVFGGVVDPIPLPHLHPSASGDHMNPALHGDWLQPNHIATTALSSLPTASQSTPAAQSATTRSLNAECTCIVCRPDSDSYIVVPGVKTRTGPASSSPDSGNRKRKMTSKSRRSQSSQGLVMTDGQTAGGFPTNTHGPGQHSCHGSSPSTPSTQLQVSASACITATGGAVRPASQQAATHHGATHDQNSSGRPPSVLDPPLPSGKHVQ